MADAPDIIKTLTPKAQLADVLLEGGLVAFLEERRPHTSWGRIARQLWEATGGRVDTSDTTVQAWYERISREATPAAS